MKKPILYREAASVAESMLYNIEYTVDCLERSENRDDGDNARLACYKALQEYFENMEFLKLVKF